MPAPDPRIVVSYARSDGAKIAAELRERSEAAGLSVWQDLTHEVGGRDWWRQITEAIDQVEYLVLVLTPAALASKVVRDEWRYARQQGTCVIPIGAGKLDDSALPGWMRRAHRVDHRRPEQWDRLLATLRSPCQVERVPMMADDLPKDFVERPHELEALIGALLDPTRQDPVAITAALKGAGGYGKTTLACAICHDEAIQEAFDEGTLWVTLGQKPDDLGGLVGDLIHTLTGEREVFRSLDAAASHLAERLADRRVLIVIDDVWNAAHLRPFLRGGPHCARLITTRNADTLPRDARPVQVDAMASTKPPASSGPSRRATIKRRR